VILARPVCSAICCSWENFFLFESSNVIPGVSIITVQPPEAMLKLRLQKSFL